MGTVGKWKISWGYICASLMIILLGSFSLSQAKIGSSDLFSWIYNQLYKILPYLFGGIYILKNKKITRTKIFDLFCMGLCMIGILCLISIFEMLSSGRENPNLISGLNIFLIPMIISFLAFALMDKKQIYHMMTGILVISFIAYLLSLGGASSITLKALQTISFSSSYSPFESHVFAGLSAALSAYFIYYRENKVITIVSILFVILTFKRASVVFALGFIIVSLFCVWKDSKTNKRIVNISVIIFTVLTMVYAFFMNPEHITKLNTFFVKYFNLNTFELTMGRNTLYSRLINSGFISAGIDSSWCYSADIEMDLVKVYIEVGFFGLLIVVAYFWQFAKANWYAYIYVLSTFFNLLTSHSFHTTTGWIVRYILLLSLLSYSSEMSTLTLKSLLKKRFGIRKNKRQF